jgi:hypothetical protein
VAWGKVLSVSPRPGPLAVGDRVRVGGGYDMDPKWLAANPSGYEGEVVEFIPGQNENLAAVVELDHELVLPDGAGAAHSAVRGSFLVLELGWVGTDWSTPSPRIHVELLVGRPEGDPFSDRQRGAWIESHASYWILRDRPPLPPSLPPIGEPSPWP